MPFGLDIPVPLSSAYTPSIRGVEKLTQMSDDSLRRLLGQLVSTYLDHEPIDAIPHSASSVP